MKKLKNKFIERPYNYLLNTRNNTILSDFKITNMEDIIVNIIERDRALLKCRNAIRFLKRRDVVGAENSIVAEPNKSLTAKARKILEERSKLEEKSIVAEPNKSPTARAREKLRKK